MTIDEIESSILGLPQSERARLAHVLLESLDDADAEDPEAVEAAWAEEIARRVSEVASKGVELIPAEQVFAEVRARLKP